MSRSGGARREPWSGQRRGEIARLVLCVMVVAACGGKQQTGGGGGSDVSNAGSDTVKPPLADTRTALEKRRDTACKAIAPKLTDCALEDAKSDLAHGVVKKADFDRDTAPEVLRKNTEMFVDKCTGWRDISSRQVRVLEVCFKEEQQCGPLRDCLGYLTGK